MHRCSGELALHVIDIIESTMIAALNKKELKMRTICTKPEPFFDPEIKKILK